MKVERHRESPNCDKDSAQLCAPDRLTREFLPTAFLVALETELPGHSLGGGSHILPVFVSLVTRGHNATCPTLHDLLLFPCGRPDIRKACLICWRTFLPEVNQALTRHGTEYGSISVIPPDRRVGGLDRESQGSASVHCRTGEGWQLANTSYTNTQQARLAKRLGTIHEMNIPV